MYKLNNFISADYYPNMTEIIGKQPIYTSRKTEYEIPIILTKSITNLNVDAGCKCPVWHKKCI